MGDWFQVHHCIVCEDHATAVRVYERIEAAADRIERGRYGPTGLRWGFWSTRVILLTTTSKWGSSPTFATPIVEGLAARTITLDESVEEPPSEEGRSRFEIEVRSTLGAQRDFLWSDKKPVMDALLGELEPYESGVAKLALLPESTRGDITLPAAAKEALGPHTWSDVVHGFTTKSGGCFVVASIGAGDTSFSESPLWTPTAATRQRGPGAWAAHSALDGNSLLPVQGLTSLDLWRIERHGAHGAWQPRAQRLFVARAALASSAVEERQAGCALARRWWLPELEPAIAERLEDAADHVRASAGSALRELFPAKYPEPRELLDDDDDDDDDEDDDDDPPEEDASGAATVPTRDERLTSARARLAAASSDPERVMAWMDLANDGEHADAVRALASSNDPAVGGAARWVAASCGSADSVEHVPAVVSACAELAAIAEPFLAHAWSGDRGRAFVERAAELAYATTRTSYWMVRYGAPGRDAASALAAIDDARSWKGEAGQSASRIMAWAARTMQVAAEPFDRRAVLRAFVAFDELLAACRANRVWWLPPIGVIHAGFAALLEGGDDEHSFDAPAPGNAELQRLQANASAVGELYRKIADSPEHHPEFERKSREALAEAPPPLAIWCYSQYGRAAFPLISWMANNLAWKMFERGAFAEALPWADLAMTCSGWDDDAVRDTRDQLRAALERSGATF